jgi:peptide/nickel transport system substrate-binding protein
MEHLFVALNFETPPFDEPLVRQAIAYAIPYEDIIQVGYYGQARRWLSLVPTLIPGFRRTDVQFNHDPERASELLAQAGYPGGEGLEELAESFRISYVAEKENVLGPVATVIKSALEEIGLPVELDPLPQTQFRDRSQIKRDMPFALNDHERPLIMDPWYALNTYFASPEAGSAVNVVNYRNAEVDDMLAKAKGELDPEVRQQLLDEVQEILMQDVVWIPILESKTQWAFSPKLSGGAWYPNHKWAWFDLTMEP